MNNKDFIEWLDDHFQGFDRSSGGWKTWYVHRWTYYGMDYGLEVKNKDDRFQLVQLLDSGYSPNPKILETDINKIYSLLVCLEPTKKGYKFDRK